MSFTRNRVFQNGSVGAVRNLFLISAPSEITDEVGDEIEKQSVYVSSNIHRIVLASDRRMFLVEHDGAASEDVLRDKVRRFLTALLDGLRPFEAKILFQRRRLDKGPLETQVYQKLIERRWVVELGDGQVALSGPALALANAVDRNCAKFGREEFKGVERHYPTMIPTSTLARCGYIGSFPQHLTMASHLREDFDSIEEFRKINVDRETIQIPVAGALDMSKACLCPALCYHCYPTLSGKQLGEEGHVETSIGRVCRYESTNMAGLDRLWEFSQRSIIWVGTEHFCHMLRQQAFDVAMRQAEEWDIDCSIESANDSFFAGVATAKGLWQRSQDMKFELRSAVEPTSQGKQRTLAAASFNLHAQFFGSAFEITDVNGMPACSGCASWGLERWVLVLFTQHGFDRSRWPASLRSEVFG
jgi:seryl-tRNA synthetase